MNGLELTQQIRLLPRDTYSYVIMLTAKSRREDYLLGVQAGVDAFLVRPLDGAMLEAQVRIATRILTWASSVAADRAHSRTATS